MSSTDTNGAKVILHQIPRGAFAPSWSPFPIKLETYLRLNKIPYEVDFQKPNSTKGKTPWITFKGEDIADSQICIHYLNKAFDVDLNKDLKKTEKAVARAIQVMVDEHLYWCLVYFKWQMDGGLTTMLKYWPIPSLYVWVLRRRLKGQLHGQGLGRHTPEEVYTFMIDDFTQLENYLGDKTYMMGEEPTEVDCSVFGMLCQFVFHFDDVANLDLKDLIKEKFPKLLAYVDRIKNEVWLDWEEVTTQGSKFPKEKK